MRFNLFSWCAGKIGFRTKASSEEIRRAYRAPYDSWKNRRAVLRFVQDIPLTPEDFSYKYLSEIKEKFSGFQKTPMLICWGQKDFIFDADFLNEWIRCFPQSEVHQFSKAGHYVLEDAYEAIIPLVRGFLKNNPIIHY